MIPFVLNQLGCSDPLLSEKMGVKTPSTVENEPGSLATPTDEISISVKDDYTSGLPHFLVTLTGNALDVFNEGESGYLFWTYGSGHSEISGVPLSKDYILESSDGLSLSLEIPIIRTSYNDMRVTAVVSSGNDYLATKPSSLSLESKPPIPTYFEPTFPDDPEKMRSYQFYGQYKHDGNFSFDPHLFVYDGFSSIGAIPLFPNDGDYPDDLLFDYDNSSGLLTGFYTLYPGAEDPELFDSSRRVGVVNHTNTRGEVLQSYNAAGSHHNLVVTDREIYYTAYSSVGEAVTREDGFTYCPTTDAIFRVKHDSPDQREKIFDFADYINMEKLDVWIQSSKESSFANDLSHYCSGHQLVNYTYINSVHVNDGMITVTFTPPLMFGEVLIPENGGEPRFLVDGNFRDYFNEKAKFVDYTGGETPPIQAPHSAYPFSYDSKTEQLNQVLFNRNQGCPSIDYLPADLAGGEYTRSDSYSPEIEGEGKCRTSEAYGSALPVEWGEETELLAVYATGDNVSSSGLGWEIISPEDKDPLKLSVQWMEGPNHAFSHLHALNLDSFVNPTEDETATEIATGILSGNSE